MTTATQAPAPADTTAYRPSETEYLADRLGFQIPEFSRVMWISDPARELWAPRLVRIGIAWADVEWLSVADGTRACALRVSSPEDLPGFSAACASKGLVALPLERQGISRASYSAVPTPLKAGDPFAYRVVVATPKQASEFRTAWAASDQDTIGRLLGYPACCRAFFERVWVQLKLIDTTWPMAVGTPDAAHADRTAEVTGHALSNILWRWMGVRAVPHLPCSFDCPETVRYGESLLECMVRGGFAEEAGWIREVLSWPVEWTALHGIAEIRTPVLKASVTTDATGHKYAVRRRGTAYPVVGARGLAFPYETPGRPLVTGSKAFLNGLAKAIEPSQWASRPDWYHTDNGFPTRTSMDAAQEPVVAAVLAALASAPSTQVIDLGCGNGALLRKVFDRAPTILPRGVDVSPERVAHAAEVLPDFANRFRVLDLFDPAALDDAADAVVLLMPGRLVEVDSATATAFRDRLRGTGARIVAYAYGDWLQKHGGLRGLCSVAGLRFDHPDDRATAGLATIA